MSHLTQVANLHMLKQQIQQQKYKIQLDKKTICYLQNKLKSQQSQSNKKISLLQNSLDNCQKQILQFKSNKIKERKLDYQKMESQIKVVNQDNRTRLIQQENYYEQILKEKQLGYDHLFSNCQHKYMKIIANLKQQNNILQNLLLSKDQANMQHQLQNVSFSIDESNKNKFINKHKFNQNSQVQNQSMQVKNRQQQLQKEFEILKQQLTLLSSKNTSLTNQVSSLTDQLSNLQKIHTTTLLTHKQTLLSLQSQSQSHHQNLSLQIKQLQNIILQYKQALQQKDQQYFQYLISKDQQLLIRRDIPIQIVKSCNHQGLILRLEDKIRIKDQHITKLQARLDEWDQAVKLNTNIHQRFDQIGNLSTRTNRVYQIQKAKIKKQVQQIHKKR